MIGMQSALNIARAVAVGRVLEAETAFLMDEVSVGRVPHPEDGIVGAPEFVAAQVIGGASERPLFEMNQDDAGELDGDGEDEQVDGDQLQGVEKF